MFPEQAAILTADPRLRAERGLAAARAALAAGAFGKAVGLVEAAEGGPIDTAGRVQDQLLRGRAAFFGDGAADAVGDLVAAAALDPDRTRWTPHPGRPGRGTPDGTGARDVA
ncbi:hypothetical protein WDV06_03115 [Streptomyces racemochromogenes]|uniref:Uncharacterized protein n=1 Tax=Streptomyces racemochromogenes TaxID=67353 RepID=A0ABW7P6X0_9ACTN